MRSLKKAQRQKKEKLTERLFTNKSQCNSTFIPFDFMKEKGKREIDASKKKYEKFRNRDFTSQILTLPGAKNITNRPLEEKKLLWKKKFDLRKVNNQAFNSEVDRKYKASRVPQSHPSHKNKEKPLDLSQTRKGYAMKSFILREKYDFLNPGN